MTMKKRGLYSDKSGLSDVVTTLIIVLLVIVAIGIVWAVVDILEEFPGLKYGGIFH